MSTSKQPKINFHRTPVTETIVILASAENIYSNFFKENNFCVLPYLIEGNNRVIYFPRIENIDKQFWKRSLKFHKTIENCKDSFVLDLANKIPYNYIDVEKFQNRFLKTFDYGWRTLISI